MAQAHIILHASEIGNWAAQERLSYFLASDLFEADIVNSGTHVDPFMPCSDVQTTPEYEQIRSQKVNIQMAQAHIILHASEIGNWAAQERLSYFLASDLYYRW
jgi:hypothetical protein